VVALRAAGWQLRDSEWSLLEMAERTGRMGEGLRMVGQELRVRGERRRELMGQLAYPAMVTLAAVAVLLLLSVWVLPQMQVTLSAMAADTPIPWITRHIGWLYGVIAVVLVGVLFVGWLGAKVTLLCGWRYPRLARLRTRLLRGIPWFGRMYQAKGDSLVLRQIHIYGLAGITLADSLQRIARFSSDGYQHERLLWLRRQLLQGMPVAEALLQADVLAEEELPLLIAAHEGGQLAERAGQVAAMLEQRVEWATKQLLKCYEPLLLALLTVAIGGLLLAYLLPMIRVFESVGAM
jgi:type II secretory pathway component PulF